MQATLTNYHHITFNEQGTAIIEGTRHKVVHLVVAKQAHGWSPEEMVFQYPHLSLAQVHAAFTYYYDHKTALDAEIQRRLEYTDQMRERNDATELKARLRLIQQSS